MTSRFTAWSQQAVTNPTIWTKPKPRTRVTVRLIPGFAGQHVVVVEPGDPRATTEINRTAVRFPDAFDDDGYPTDACRTFITEAVREAVRRDQHQRWITWPDGTTTAFTRDDLTPIARSPSLRLVR